ncbi:MAG: 50S ribosomal protein L31 [Ardenticatenia bacterium]|nr:50S ribosomal protein L31 [Ardenticatenia bacterium]MBK8538686.1 50S ribosomal protein L31 [Ardenticatenia bacterium]
MKKDLHPQTHPVIFVDGTHEIISRSTLKSGSQREIDGVQHYLIPVEISAFTHPFYTGEQRIIDTAGQVERFMRRLEVGVKQRDVQSQQVIDRKEQERDAKRQRRGLTPLQKKAADAEDASEG